MGNFFTSLFSSSKPAEATEDKAKNEQKNFDILKYDGVRAQKMGKLAYAIKCFTEALNIQEDFETMSYLVSAYTMALDLDMLKQIAAKSNYPEYGISGRINYVTEKGKKQIGISGNKANHADLTVELGFSSDLGVTNDRFPHEVGEGQGNMMGFAMTGAQVSTEDMEDVDLYLQTLGVPARRNVDDPTVLQGEQLFYQAKCHLCHVTSLKTRPRGSVLLNNMELPQLGNQVIHPYSDFLLHDMGVELGDDYPSGLANGNEWRTTPLWGLGLQEVVNGHTYYLHDGRARNLTEAIMWHGGEGAASRTLFSRMTKDERAALIKFLQSL